MPLTGSALLGMVACLHAQKFLAAQSLPFRFPKLNQAFEMPGAIHQVKMGLALKRMANTGASHIIETADVSQLMLEYFEDRCFFAEPLFQQRGKTIAPPRASKGPVLG